MESPRVPRAAFQRFSSASAPNILSSRCRKRKFDFLLVWGLTLQLYGSSNCWQCQLTAKAHTERQHLSPIYLNSRRACSCYHIVGIPSNRFHELLRESPFGRGLPPSEPPSPGNAVASVLKQHLFVPFGYVLLTSRMKF